MCIKIQTVQEYQESYILMDKAIIQLDKMEKGLSSLDPTKIYPVEFSKYAEYLSFRKSLQPLAEGMRKYILNISKADNIAVIDETSGNMISECCLSQATFNELMKLDTEIVDLEIRISELKLDLDLLNDPDKYVAILNKINLLNNHRLFLLNKYDTIKSNEIDTVKHTLDNYFGPKWEIVFKLANDMFVK